MKLIPQAIEIFSLYPLFFVGGSKKPLKRLRLRREVGYGNKNNQVSYGGDTREETQRTRVFSVRYV